ncbi:hypothetical protein K501DRAFT_274339 [Backusella circina FSU 941]|nr:hypothetical protein K501DRAFT_274339 [Backusella circina FSU 941]
MEYNRVSPCLLRLAIFFFSLVDLIGITKSCIKWKIMAKDVASLPNTINKTLALSLGFGSTSFNLDIHVITLVTSFGNSKPDLRFHNLDAQTSKLFGIEDADSRLHIIEPENPYLCEPSYYSNERITPLMASKRSYYQGQYDIFLLSFLLPQIVYFQFFGVSVGFGVHKMALTSDGGVKGILFWHG